MMKLHYTAASPFSRKVLILAHEGGLINRLQLSLANVGTHVSLDTPAHTALGRLNGLMKIPVLETSDGKTLFDSRVICEYLATLCPEKSFFPSHGEGRWTALRNQALADGIMDAALLCRFEGARETDRRSIPWLQSQNRRISQGLDQLEQFWPEGTQDITIGDISTACALGYLDFRFGALEWRAARPKLDRWFRQFSERDSMRLTVPEVVPAD